MPRELIYETATDRYPPRRKGYQARQTAKKRRAEGPVIKRVRAACVERDGYCRYGKEDPLTPCDGASEWAHLGEKKRHKTRNMAATERHTTAGSLMLCRKHHGCYDGRRLPKLLIRPLTSLGADGSLHFIDETDRG